MRRFAVGLVLFALACAPRPAAETAAYDVVVYGATPGGVSAAVNAAREGVSVALFQPDGHLGGLASGGLSNTDFKSFEAVGGTFREFMQRVKAHYEREHGATSQQAIDSVEGGYYEPRVARQVFEEMLQEAGVTVYLDRRLVEAAVETAEGGQRIVSARFADDRSGDELEATGRVFVDATYEGDLLAAAGVEYRVGCETKSEYGESLAFDEPNDYVQTYNFRVCLTRDPSNRLPLPKPEGYSREEFAPLIGYIEDGTIEAFNQEGHPRQHVLKIRPMPNLKADFNDNFRSPISLSIENVNHPWPEGSPEVRQAIYGIYKNHSLGLFWFLAHDEEVPEDWRTQMREWGLPRDEYPENGHWSPALYVREGRRMAGRYVYTQHDTQPEDGSIRARLHRDSVAIGDYPMNCHGVWAPGPAEPQIGHFSEAVQPFQVPYGVLLSKTHGNLLAPVPVSASHVGFSALRMEPTWTALGQAAGVAAAMSLKTGIPLGDLDAGRIQMRLHELGALTVYVSDLGEWTAVPRPGWDPRGGKFHAYLHSVPPRSPYFRAVQYFGTQGFFHVLAGADAETSKEIEPTTGQWGGRKPNHAVRPEAPIGEDLARIWREMAREMGLRADFEANPEMARGDFLRALFEEVAIAAR